MQKISAGKFHLEPPSRFTSVDHLVGEREQLVGYFEAERLSGLEIDDELVLGRRLHRQVGWLLTLQNTIDVGGCAPERVDCIRSIGDQSAASGVIAYGVDRG